MKSLLSLSVVFCIFCTAFAAGFLVRDEWDTVSAQTDAAFPLLQEAVTYVDLNYVKDIPDQKTVEYALIRAYLGELGDPNSFFIEPAVAASESDALTGRYGGIGVELQRDEAGNFVMYPYADSSALAAGIRGGDIILAVNGQAVDLSTPMDEVRQLLRGEIEDGAGVTLLVRNIVDDEGQEREYFIPFAEVLVPSVTWRTLFEAPEIGYVNVTRFTARTPEEFRQAVESLQSEDVKAIVLDLRGNHGGLLHESILVAGEFFDGGVLSRERRVSGESVKEDTDGGVLLDLPVVVLVDNDTASASEIVAGAIQARGRGILIGQPTFGKGSIQSIFPLSDSSSIHVTVALWYTPDGSELDGVGLTPDISMIPDENGRDVELGEAVRYLRGELVAQQGS